MKHRLNLIWKLVPIWMALAIVILVIMVPLAEAAVTGWLDPTATQGYGSRTFSNPDRAYHDDTQYANGTAYSSILGYQPVGQYYSGYATNIPPGSVIQGIEVRVHYWVNGNNGSNWLEVALWNATNNAYTTVRAETSEPSSESSFTFGTNADLWGTSWTADDINNLQVRVQGFTDRISGRTFYLDWVSVRVTYIAANASIGGQVYRDTDGDGIHDSGETTGINSVTVWARRQSDNSIVATAVTAGNGNYTLTGLLPGTYWVDVDQTDSDLPTNYGVTSTDPLSVTLTESQVVTGRDFGFTLLSSIGDRVWYDTDHGGDQDAGENSLSGATVRLYRDNGNSNFEPGAGDTLVGTQTTSALAANYNFTNLTNGSYWVYVDTSTLSGRTDLTAGSNPRLVTITTFGTTVNNADFGFDDTGVIGDLIWNDADGDGTFDTGESGLNWQVSLTDQSNTTITQTAVSGAYSFVGLPTGVYYTVTVTAPDGWAQTNFINNPLVINLPAGTPYTTADFGFDQTSANISGYVWYDPNRNGIRDSGEITNINGMNVDLYRGTTYVRSASTNSNGFYFFGGLTPGDYSVRETGTPPNPVWTLTTANPQNVSGVVAGQSYPNHNFGFSEPAAVVKQLYLHRNDLLDRNRPPAPTPPFKLTTAPAAPGRKAQPWPERFNLPAARLWFGCTWIPPAALPGVEPRCRPACG